MAHSGDMVFTCFSQALGPHLGIQSQGARQGRGVGLSLPVVCGSLHVTTVLGCRAAPTPLDGPGVCPSSAPSQAGPGIPEVHPELVIASGVLKGLHRLRDGCLWCQGLSSRDRALLERTIYED